MAEKDTTKNPLLGDEGQADTQASGEKPTKQKPVEKPTEDEKPDVEEGDAVHPTAPAAADGNKVQQALVSDAMLTKQKLDKRPKVQFMVPLGLNEKPGAYEEVYINGYRYTIAKGKMVTIPDRVAELLANKYQIELEAGQESRIDRSERVADALS